ncbi:sodium/hydrogen exchanger [Stackebrandtia nassauensis DSM 44728]|uniref:Sodium/hydrogen exchanger n=1 Tax=Stackebrandtia nassauensis (strain DSM 44728 / CIP 108903 / NRRL B-16338 / NBRC 102104 / LLR-40K-21) TaxID=446470 RepID=D3QAR8_STANL|nr:cation:proton antiporter [Stackebrandtia nassauensis]ADD44714.1 sodium/hydrogen exchanger [Stackebrandtia nassauensis DSM 44728]
MELTLVVIVGVISIVVVAAFSQRLGLAAPLSLVIVGIGLSFVPGVPHPDIAPELVLAGVLPPLLYSSAVTMPVVDFRRNLKPISGLAVLLVVVTTLGAGCLFHWLLPGIGWPVAFALGAVVSPTDAIAATSVGRKLGLPHRLLTVLEGEGLVNDASALVLLRSATAAIAGTVSVWLVAGQFFYAVVIAVGVGIGVGVINVRVRALLKDPVLNTAISFVIPFIAYLPAEELDASGVLSVVVAGIVAGHLGPKHLRAEDRITEATNWRTLAFLLENATFLLMGLNVESLVDEAAGHEMGVGWVIVIGLLASALVIVARMVFTAPLVATMRREQRRAEKVQPVLKQIRGRLTELDERGKLSDRKKKHLHRRFTRASADVDFRLNETLGWRGGVVLAWSGMRGAITVAAAQTLPQHTPLRPQLILIAFVVATTTLLLQGLTLPTVIRLVKVPGDDPGQQREEYRRLLGELTEAAADVLNDPDLVDSDGRAYESEVIEKVRTDARVPDGKGDSEERHTPAGDVRRREQYLRLRLRVLKAESDRLIRNRSVGVYSSDTLSLAQRMIDVDTARLEQLAEGIASDLRATAVGVRHRPVRVDGRGGQPHPARHDGDPQSHDAQRLGRHRAAADEPDDHHDRADPRVPGPAGVTAARLPGRDHETGDRDEQEGQRPESEVEHAVDGGGGGLGAGREARHRIRREDATADEAQAVAADQPARPDRGAGAAQGAREPDRGRDRHQPAQDEVGLLDPAEVAEHEQAQRVPREVEALAGERQHDAHDEVEATGDHAPAEQGPGHRRRGVEGRFRRGVVHRRSSSLDNYCTNQCSITRMSALVH